MLLKLTTHFTRRIAKLLAVTTIPRKFQLYLHTRPRKLVISKSRPTEMTLSRFRRRLCRKGTSSIDSFAVLEVLKACSEKKVASSSALIQEKQIHALIVHLGLERVVFLQTTLMKVYSQVGDLTGAHRVFNDIPQKSMVCWTALISAYVNNAKPKRALELFRLMQMEGIEPDQVTITITLSACADLGALAMGEWIHAYVRRKQGFFTQDLILSNALINMYAKCGDIETSRHLFDTTTTANNQRDITTWTSMIMGHALHGQADEALRLFAELKDHKNKNNNNRCCPRIIPNQITFLGVLMACSHAGLVEEGLQHLESMNKDYGLKPQISHHGCMVDLFARAGLLKEAFSFVESMPIRPNAVIWRTLLGACSLYNDVDLGTRARRRLLELEPDYIGDDITMSNAYAATGMWDEKENVRKRVKHRWAPGCSLIEVESKVHEFVAADRRNPQWREIYMVLEGISKNLRSSSFYAPDCLSLKLHDDT